MAIYLLVFAGGRGPGHTFACFCRGPGYATDLLDTVI